MILLDTHTWVWWVCRRTDLIPPGLDDFLSNTEEEVALASVSCLEVALLVKKGRLLLSRDLGAWFALAIDGCGVQLLPLTPSIAVRSAALPDIHRDPIDRVLIATAMEYDAAIATKDGVMSSYPGLRVRWE